MYRIFLLGWKSKMSQSGLRKMKRIGAELLMKLKQTNLMRQIMTSKPMIDFYLGWITSNKGWGNNNEKNSKIWTIRCVGYYPHNYI